LEALLSLAAQVQDLVLGDIDGSSLLATSMSTVVERLESRIVKDRRRRPEGGGEWEPIKIPQWNLVYIPNQI
jgi:hypothetical protein